MVKEPGTGEGSADPGSAGNEEDGVTAERIAVPWSDSIVEAAAARLLAGDLGSPPGDLRRVLVVVPGGRAGRLLLRELGGRAEAAGLALVPPRVTTPGVLPTVLSEAADVPPPASASEVLLSAIAAVESAAPADRAIVFGDEPDVGSAAVHAAAVRLVGLEHELAAGGRGPADAADRLRSELREEEAQAWEAVRRIADDRRRRLAEAGLRDASLPLPAAVLSGLDPAFLPAAVVLVGPAELPAAARAVLGAAAAAGVRLLTAVRGTPDTGVDGFDALGCVVPEAWAETDVVEDESTLQVAESLGDQAALAVQWAAELTRGGAADDLVLGVIDPALRRPLAVAAAAAGGSIHVAGGRRLGERPSWRLLERLAAWCRSPRAAVLADLLRIPRFERLVAAAGDGRRHAGAGSGRPSRRDAPALFDELLREHLPDRLDELRLEVDEGEDPRGRARIAVTRRAIDEADRLGAPLRAAPAPLSAWSGPLAEVLATANRDRDGGGDEEDAEEWVRLARLADGLAALPPALDRTVEGVEALETLLRLAADEMLPERPEPEAIDAVGLLELPFDPAPCVVVAGLHDESAPGRGRRDPLLPEPLRRSLGLAADADRRGRDAYLLAAAVRGRRAARIVAGRRGAGGDPLVPSRLLLPADPARLAPRLARLVDPDRVARPRALPVPGGNGDGFPVPILRGLPVPDRIRVTAFRDHLACPYRFALAHVLGLEVVEDDPRELDAGRFGTVLHAALQAFGEHAEDRRLRDADRIAAALEHHLDAVSRRRFGRAPRPAVRLQLDRMRQRLQHVARLEAAWREEGWRTVAVEHRLEDAAIQLEDGFTMPVTGIVDRIDRHERTGRWRIVDYKTGDTARSPYEAHHGRKRLPPPAEARWTDLQLPLYAHLLMGRPVGEPAQTIEGPVELGYVLLPRAAARVAWEPAEWTPAHLDAALEEARRIVAEVRTGDYEPAERAPRFDRYPWIVQRPPLLLGDEGDPAALREDDEEPNETAAAGGAPR